MVNTVAIMCKNEENTIGRTCLSIVGWVDIVVIYDTGSTDRTLEVIRDFFHGWNRVKLYIFEGEFEDFATSRNKLLDYCNSIPEIDYVLLMDSNDELYSQNIQFDTLTAPAYNIKQRWYEHTGSINEYLNVRLIKTNSGWYYKGKVHEVLLNDKIHHPELLDITLVQKREYDYKKTQARLPQDLEILEKQYKELTRENWEYSEEIPEDLIRCLTYLIQTNIGLGTHAALFIHYCHTLINILKYYENYNPELHYNTLLIMGAVEFERFGWDEGARPHYQRAMELDPTRCEAFLAFVEHYLQDRKTTLLAFMYANYACRLEPKILNLNVNKLHWEVTRWKMYAVVCLILGSDKEDIFLCGKEACDIMELNAKKLNYELNQSELALISEYKRLEKIVAEQMTNKLNEQQQNGTMTLTDCNVSIKEDK